MRGEVEGGLEQMWFTVEVTGGNGEIAGEASIAVRVEAAD